MAIAGGLKAAAKRTAFGDVSNTANLSRPSKDDSAIYAKGDCSIIEKPITLQAQDRRPTALLRPAQRPLSVAGLKNLLHNVSGPGSQVSAKQPLTEIQQSTQMTVPQQANTKKVATKKSTAVFKDSTFTQADLVAVDSHKSSLSNVPLPPVHRELAPQTHLKQLKSIEENISNFQQEPTRRSDDSKVGSRDVRPSELPLPSDDGPAFRSDGIYIDNNGDIRQYLYEDDVKPVDDNTEPLNEASVLASHKENERPVDDLDRLLDAQLQQASPDLAVKQTLAPAPEPEEYWDGEDGENYEEEGYVTARSFKSRGDNTTCGVTTVLFPKFNQKIKRELAAAKELIESTKTDYDIFDETWDTTMVAEYGDEIFQYMRDLEVRT